VCKSLSLTIRYSDQIEVTKIARMIQETCWEVDLSPHLSTLFKRCVRRRVRLRQMIVSMTGLTAYAEQVSLFDERPLDSQRTQERAKSLALALDTLHARFGEQAIRYGRSH
jgi:DNA polymerase-4